MPSALSRYSAILRELPIRAWFSYATLLLLQLKVLQGIGRYRDLTFGDTSGYFLDAVSWSATGTGNIAWSPLYTFVYGTAVSVFSDAYAATTLHRVVIVLIVTTLVLALMRRLLPPGIAWLVGAWWVTLPVTFDALYEVHLFGAIPVLVASLVAASRPTIWVRGATLGVLLASTVLVRNEMSIATGLWVVCCLAWEAYQWRRGAGAPLRTILLAYGVPSLLAVAVISGVYSRSTLKFPDLSRVLQVKHTLNVCQIYAYNYQQRRTDWTKSAWTECHELMQRDFGVPEPSMAEAIRRNPSAMFDYFSWNARLIPDGLQILLFNETAGVGQPDYIARVTNSTRALVLSILSVLTVMIGGYLLIRGGWRGLVNEQQAWSWLVLLCTGVVMVTVMLMQRPRPSYLFGMSILLAGAIGLCLSAIVERTVRLTRLTAAVPVVALALLIIVPPYFTPEYKNPGGHTGRPLLQQYYRLAPFEPLMRVPGSRILGNGWTSTLCSYIGAGQCTAFEYPAFLATKPSDTSLADWLKQEEVTLFYADENALLDPGTQAFLANPAAAGWRTLADVESPVTGRWRLFERPAESGDAP